MSRRTKRNYSEQLQEIVDAYRQAGEPWPARTIDISTWAFANGYAEFAHQSIKKMFARDLQKAMREEYITDPQGRRVRKKHAYRVDGETLAGEHEQMHLWCDIETASHDEMKISFQQRRQQVVGDCKQLKTDVDSYNENFSDGPVIQLSLDFTYDVEESEQDTEYNPKRNKG